MLLRKCDDNNEERESFHLKTSSSLRCDILVDLSNSNIIIMEPSSPSPTKSKNVTQITQNHRADTTFSRWKSFLCISFYCYLFSYYCNRIRNRICYLCSLCSVFTLKNTRLLGVEKTSRLPYLNLEQFPVPRNKRNSGNQCVTWLFSYCSLVIWWNILGKINSPITWQWRLWLNNLEIMCR